MVASQNLTPQQRRELAARAQVTERTVKQTYLGIPGKPTTRDRVVAAAAAAGLPLPPVEAGKSAA